jgi:hypothetical protein
MSVLIVMGASEQNFRGVDIDNYPSGMLYLKDDSVQKSCGAFARAATVPARSSAHAQRPRADAYPKSTCLTSKNLYTSTAGRG